MKYTRETLEQFIDDIREHGHDRGLTKWEEDFAERGRLSEKQVETLDRIYAERTP